MKHKNEQAGLFSMNRGWKFIEKDFSVRPLTKNHDDVYGFSKGGAARGPAEAGFDDSDWEEVTLPHDWVTKKEFTEHGSPNQGYKERGIGWYRIKFALSEEDRNKQILLEFEGMSADAEIYVNGMLLKRNFSGYNSFSVDMTDMANFGVIPNTLAIRIDASGWEGWWYEGAGIYRNVWLIKKSATHIASQGIWIHPVCESEAEPDGMWSVQIEATLENSFEKEEQVEMEHVLLDPSGNVAGVVTQSTSVPGFGKKQINSSIGITAPKLWSMEDPALYTVKSSVRSNGIKIDYQINPAGFRTIRLDADTGFWLNGASVKLKGFCNHQDHAGVGVAVPYRVKEYRILKLKELGANAYRCAHNPDPEILEICDRLGLAVMEENRTFSSAADNLEEIKGIIRNARNHPSVILYSVLNEEPLQGTGKGRRIAGRLQAAIKELDTSRPVLGAFNGGYLEEEGAATILDSVGINYNPVRYDEFHKKFPGTPLIGSETASAFMVRGEHQTDYEKHIIDDYDSESALWGNTVQEAWKYVKERPFVAGTFVWTGFDYRGEPTPFIWPSVGTYFGTYDSCGFEKNACFRYQAYWKREPMVHLASSWEKKIPEGTPIKIQIYSNCPEIELFVNNVSCGRQKIDPYAQAECEIPYEAGTLKAVAYRDGQAVAEDFQQTALLAEKIQIVPAFSSVKNDGFDAAIFNISLTDKNGTVIPDAENLILFEIENGEILGVGNGNPVSHEPDVAPYRKLFHGKAQIIVRAGEEESLILRAATTEGIAEEVRLPVTSGEEIPFILPVNEQVVDGWKLYYQLFDEMPDPSMQTDINDMNSFEPVAFTGQPQPELSGRLGKYAMYRAYWDAGNPCAGRKLYFPEIFGHVYIYLDGEEVARRKEGFGGSMIVSLSNHLEGKHEITVIVQNGNREYPEAGICSPVCMIKE